MNIALTVIGIGVLILILKKFTGGGCCGGKKDPSKDGHSHDGSKGSCCGGN